MENNQGARDREARNPAAAVAKDSVKKAASKSSLLPLNSIEKSQESQEAVAMLQQQQQNDDDDDDDDSESDSSIELSASLTPNTYSIIYVANPKTLAFFFGIVFFLFQVSLASLALVDLLDFSSKNNVIKAPANIPSYVRAAGYLSVVLAVPLFTDLLDSIERIHEGYDRIVLKQAPNATLAKFWLACTCQFFSGALFQVVIFLLIVQSTTVISMLLNFAALQFVTEVDDVAFSLAERGYFSESIERDCHAVQALKTPNTKGPWFRRIAFLLIELAVLAGYSNVYIQQESGAFLCNRIEVQFGDETLSWLPLSSGVFYVDKAKRENDRYVYLDEASEYHVFRYCRSEEAWVFGTFPELDFGGEAEEDDFYDEICNPLVWVSKSPSTRSFSILDVKPSDWFTASNIQNALVYPVQHFVIQCLDCAETTCNALGGTCQDVPELSDDQVCECYEGFAGNECQFDVNSTVCESITFDRRFDPFQEGGFSYATRYSLVADHGYGTFMDFFGKTVYAYTYQENEERFGWLDVIAYYGRRYFLTTMNWEETFPNATVDTAAQIYVEYIRHLRYEGYALGNDTITDPVFMSDPLDLASGRDKLTPTNLNWYYTQNDIYGVPLALGPSVSTRLVCEQCNEENESCSKHGVCVRSGLYDYFGTCKCDEGYVGPLCESYDPDAYNSTQC